MHEESEVKATKIISQIKQEQSIAITYKLEFHKF